MRKYLIIATLILAGTGLRAQKTDTIKQTNAADSLLNSMNADKNNENVSIFKSTRLILTQSAETDKKKNFNFEIIHRFGDFAGATGGAKYAYGLDDVADVDFRFEYGLSDNFNVILERSTIGGLIDLELKYAILHQKADGSSPVAITVLGERGVRPFGSFTTLDSRLSTFAEAIFARKFSSGFSMEIAPSFISNNSAYPNLPGVDQQFVSLSAAMRFKLTKHMGFIVDYAHPFSSSRNNSSAFSDPLGFGIEMVTGGHVFTVNIVNSKANSEINYLSNTQSDYGRGQYRIGFTISRMFDFNHREVYKRNGE